MFVCVSLYAFTLTRRPLCSVLMSSLARRRYDLFNMRLRLAVFTKSGLTYRLRDLWEAAWASDDGPSPMRGYRGPSLGLLPNQPRLGEQLWPQLLVLDVPGILEVTVAKAANLKVTAND